VYTATSRVGALGLVKSHELGRGVRVLRRQKDPADPREPYRYGGLYEIESYEGPAERGGLYRFHLRRRDSQPGREGPRGSPAARSAAAREL
jgi:hypothetical protein